MRLAAANAGDRRVSTGLPGFMDETRALPMLLSSRREELMECSTYTYSSARGASGKRTRLTCRFWRLAKRTFLPRVLSLTEEEKVRGGGAPSLPQARDEGACARRTPRPRDLSTIRTSDMARWSGEISTCKTRASAKMA